MQWCYSCWDYWKLLLESMALGLCMWGLLRMVGMLGSTIGRDSQIKPWLEPGRPGFIFRTEVFLSVWVYTCGAHRGSMVSRSKRGWKLPPTFDFACVKEQSYSQNLTAVNTELTCVGPTRASSNPLKLRVGPQIVALDGLVCI